MTAFKTGLSLLATIAIFAAPTAAQAEYLIPPNNSAATQYTEAVPTAGGPKATDPSNHGKHQSPSKVLGGRNAERLDAQGPEGQAVAEVAAETAPVAVVAAGSDGASQDKHRSASQPGTNDAGSGGGSGAAGRTGNGGSGVSVRDTILTSQEIPDGSSGLGEVLAQATGSSDSGQLGLLLPLIVLGAIAWSVAYVLRRRKRPIQ
jgi:cytoskeletal protein RodZ